MAKNALIIGAGLAGTCLAHRLLSSGIDVQILDQGSNHSSAIAAGMVETPLHSPMASLRTQTGNGAAKSKAEKN